MPGVTTNLHERLAKVPYNFHPTIQSEVVGETYHPLWFTRLGNRSGEGLEFLSQVRGDMGEKISFGYKLEDGSEIERVWPLDYRYQLDDGHPTFEIDGRGGERFVKAKLTLEITDPEDEQDAFVYGELSSATLITNRAREFCLGDWGPQYDGDLVTSEIDLPAGQVIIGIYGVPGGLSLGIASEEISGSSE
ncbi:unnamed protein product [Clonostachys rosea]|uniref:Uncharacterized protein n=1 Tax=Bionectria ochroleuca TaxID=29856 RepID=A0ABY6UWT1_BIOOC|nr:unnamed protein product [Clonostachys rosea]